MSYLARSVLLPIAGVLCLLPIIIAQADPVPTIATFELKKQHDETVAARRDPKAFWVRQIVLRIAAKKILPPKSLKGQVTVALTFVVGRDGKLVSKEITKSSGNPDVDGIAMAMLDRAAPFPPMPASVTDDTISFNLPLRFR